ncbi:unnamed protein product [Moneuplotes crassus]|uniref:Uncharacterized protein n=1 Tax=Euplotes crassus TaxID=5936 RepID=A0AAD1X521_EUPCR|nr:unnamed protein product [Moneuplotes crassus]
MDYRNLSPINVLDPDYRWFDKNDSGIKPLLSVQKDQCNKLNQYCIFEKGNVSKSPPPISDQRKKSDMDVKSGTGKSTKARKSRRIYTNLYHPSFSTKMHFMKMANALGKRPQNKTMKNFDISQGNLDQENLILGMSQEAPKNQSMNASMILKQIRGRRKNRSNTAGNLQPFLQYFYSGTKIIKYGTKKTKALADSKRDFAFVSNLNSKDFLKKMIKQRHPSMFNCGKRSQSKEPAPFSVTNSGFMMRPNLINQDDDFALQSPHTCINSTKARDQSSSNKGKLWTLKIFRHCASESKYLYCKKAIYECEIIEPAADPPYKYKQKYRLTLYTRRHG